MPPPATSAYGIGEQHSLYVRNCLCVKHQITRIANEVNAQMDKEENFLKMYKIQASFIGNVKCLVKEGRVFVREGALIKMCRKVSGSPLPSRPAYTTRPSPGPSPDPPQQVPKKRWFFLFNDALVYGSLVGADKAEKVETLNPPPPSLTPVQPQNNLIINRDALGACSCTGFGVHQGDGRQDQQQIHVPPHDRVWKREAGREEPRHLQGARHPRLWRREIRLPDHQARTTHLSLPARERFA